jgi:hypothetical protein
LLLAQSIAVVMLAPSINTPHNFEMVFLAIVVLDTLWMLVVTGFPKFRHSENKEPQGQFADSFFKDFGNKLRISNVGLKGTFPDNALRKWLIINWATLIVLLPISLGYCPWLGTDTPNNLTYHEWYSGLMFLSGASDLMFTWGFYAPGFYQGYKNIE